MCGCSYSRSKKHAHILLVFVNLCLLCYSKSFSQAILAVEYFEHSTGATNEIFGADTESFEQNCIETNNAVIETLRIIRGKINLDDNTDFECRTHSVCAVI